MKNSKKLFKRAVKHIPGGVNSPVRSFKSVGGSPVYIESGKGSKIYDVDGKEYIDFCGSWGPLALGHAHPDVVNAVCSASRNGLSFGTCNPLEVEMAELFCKMVPCADMVRMVNSGTEAVMTALRLARAFTGKTHILKFDGCYHGHTDCLLSSAGSGLLTNSIPSSAGVTQKVISEVITTPYNRPAAVKNIFRKDGNKIAAVIVEPVAGNMGLVMPEKGFLETLRELCSEYETCLIFDEVITGFRFHAGSYATLARINPDISVFGKIIGGGMPIGAIAAGRKVMEMLAPLGNVYQAGTLSGNPVALAAGIATLKTLRKLNPYHKMAELAENFAMKINSFAQERGLGVHCAVYGGVFTLFFSSKKSLKNLEDVKTCNTALFAEYFKFMLQRGFYISPSQFELNFVSAAHTMDEINAAAEASVEFLSIRT
ncbi:MAG: glutamate-1-semialdehyde-2,1-aminomutase [Lentisphaerae bacterium GWF2_44_16]|nr:MAG: glutamate-1-semialdehyde-2,1-aminomutase [Lentisphaerae bacterium GWF2_44_16]